MTSDYYINLANYYTHQLSSGSPSESITLNVSNVSIAFDNYFTNTLGATYYTIEKWLTWSGSSNLILYGSIEIGGITKNYILRVPYANDTYDLSGAEIYTTYAGGTAMPYFWDLIVDNDGSLYGIVASSSPDSNGFALIMLGNPFITGGIKFRQSYIIPNTYSSYTNYQTIIKKENTGEYLIIFNDGGTNTIILHLTINVGGTNTWTSATVNDYLDIYDYYISWGDNISLNLLSYDNVGESYDYIIRFNVYNYNGSSISLTTSYSSSIGSRFKSTSAKYYDENTFYYQVSYLSNYGGGSGTAYNILYKGYLPNNSNVVVKLVTNSYNTTTPYVLLSDIGNRQQIEIKGGVVYFKYLKTVLPNPNNKDVYGVVINGNVYTVDSTILRGTMSFNSNYNSFFVSNIFNKYKMVMPGESFTDFIDFQYDSNGYNGTPYIDKTMFIPHRVKLYDNLSTLLFDRDLYNLRVYNNVTESTFNVPYTMLNSDTISEAIMYGKTGYDLVDESLTINKNIYENLMINFFNSIVVKDYTGRIYNDGGSRVNDSISKTNDMSNTSVNKIKIFYSDDTTYTYVLPTPTITGSGNPMTITYDIALLVASDGYVLKYQILSNDENTLYFEYDTSSLNAGTYKITQECKIK